MGTTGSSGKSTLRDKVKKACRQALSQTGIPDTIPVQKDSVREAWVRNSPALAKFTLEHLRNRIDTYGNYLPLENRVGNKKCRTYQGCPTEEVVTQHFCATDRGDLIGLHTTSPENTCRWFVIDIDHHGDLDQEAELRNEKGAFTFARILSDLGANPLVMKSNGRGGFHIWIIFDKPSPAAEVYAFCKSVVQDCEKLGIDKPEVYPKQPKIEDGKFGNWVRLPGLHHTYDFYTQVWDGEKWLDGEDAINQILKNKLSPAELPTQKRIWN